MQAVRFEVVGQSNIDFENFKPIAHDFVERRRDGVDKRFKDGLLQTTLELASMKSLLIFTITFLEPGKNESAIVPS